MRETVKLRKCLPDPEKKHGAGIPSHFASILLAGFLQAINNSTPVLNAQLNTLLGGPPFSGAFMPPEQPKVQDLQPLPPLFRKSQ